MGTQALPLFYDRRDKLGKTLVISIALHAALFVGAIVYTSFHFQFGRSGRPGWGGGGAVRVGAVASLPGVPLPAPMIATHNIVATQNEGLHKAEPEPKVQPPPEAKEIPKFKDSVKPEKAQRIAKRLQKEEDVPPPNAIPYGLGGKPNMSYSPVVSGAGEGGLSLGEGGSFGNRYGWYVAGVRNRISGNWLLSTVSPTILTAPRVYMTFEIHRDGSIDNVQITQSSGIPEVDRSALRAVLASNPLAPLPPDYSGSSVKVDFYFDFHRR